MTRRFDLPAMFDAPAAVLRDLHAIDPLADLLYVGRGHWLLGAWVDPSTIPDGGAERRAAGIAQVTDARRLAIVDWPYLRSGLLAAHGFGVISEYHQGRGGPARQQCDGAPDSAVVHDFRERHWNWTENRTAFKAAIEAQFISEQDYQRRELERTRTRARRHAELIKGEHRFLFRHPCSVTAAYVPPVKQERVA